jgi:hypothetical protein
MKLWMAPSTVALVTFSFAAVLVACPQGEEFL